MGEKTVYNERENQLQTPQMLHMECWVWNLTLIAD